MGLGENPEPGGADGSARQPEPEAPGIAGRSSILRPVPRSRAPPSALPARSPPFPFRVCVGVRRSGRRARGRAGRRGGARGSARGGGRGPGAPPRPRLARRSGRRRPGRCQSEGTAGDRRCSPVSPARRHPVLPRRPPPTVGVGQRRGEPGRKAGGRWRDEQPLRVGSGGAGKETFPSRPPRMVPSPRLPSRRLGTAPEAGGARSGLDFGESWGGLWGDVHWGSVCHRPPSSQWPGWGGGHGRPRPGFPPDGGRALGCLLLLQRV